MCKKIINWTMHNSPTLQHLGLTIIRIGFGITLTIFGYNKLFSGTANLTQLGSAMGLFGITRGYVIWGYLAALTELCGGFAYAIGLWTRIVSLPLMWLLIVAVKFHIQKGDAFTVWAFPVTCLCITIGFLFAGSGIYSADHVLHSATRTNNHDF